jgi:hypothetical protein
MGALIIAAWPQTPVRPTGLWYDAVFTLFGLKLPTGLFSLGHAACILVSEQTARAHYFDCGRYDCPPHTCRIRDDERDPELTVSVRARFGPDGSLINAAEILVEVAENDATHGEGIMIATVMNDLKFEAAHRRAKDLQARTYPFHHLSMRGLHCTRFILRMTPFARATWALRALEACSRWAGPGTLFLARVAGDSSPLFVVDQNKVSRRGRWSVFVRGRPPLLSRRAFELDRPRNVSAPPLHSNAGADDAEALQPPLVRDHRCGVRRAVHRRRACAG